MGYRVRRIGSSYLEFGEAKVDNPGHGNETVTLIFEGRYAIIFNWVQLVLVVGRGDEDLKHSNGPSKEFFEIWATIQKEEGFRRLREARLKTWLIAEESDDCLTSVEDFKTKFFVKNSLQFVDELKDLAITVEDKKGNRSRSVNFGPYNGPPDFEKHKLWALEDKKTFHGPERGNLFRLWTGREYSDAMIMTEGLLH